MKLRLSEAQITLGAIIIGVLLIIGVIVVLNKPSSVSTNQQSATPLTSADGQQVIEITARGGYTPNFVEAKANAPATLVMKTRNAYDCSIALVIPKLQIRQNLPITGDTRFAIPPQAPDTEITGTCSMGMYFFKIQFV